MFKLSVLLFITFGVGAFETLDTPLLPHHIRYLCDDRLLETKFVAALQVWNSEVENYFVLEKVSSNGNADVIVQWSTLQAPHLGATLPTMPRVILVDNFISAPYSLDMVLLHEVGHLLGLDHSSDVSAVMFPNLVATHPFALGTDDAVGIRWLYWNHSVDLPISYKLSGSRIKLVSSIPVHVDFGDCGEFNGVVGVHRFTAAGDYVVTVSYSHVCEPIPIHVGRKRGRKLIQRRVAN